MHGHAGLLEAGYDIAAIFTIRTRLEKNNFFGSVARIAAERGIPVYAPDDVNHPLWVDRIRALAPDVIFSFYIATCSLTRSWSGRKRRFIFNGSLLPAYRGRAPLNWVLVNGETENGRDAAPHGARADAGASWHSRRSLLMRTKLRCSCIKS